MTKNCHNDYKMKFSVDEEFPDLSQHNNHMAKVKDPPFPFEESYSVKENSLSKSVELLCVYQASCRRL